MRPKPPPGSTSLPRHGVARVISKSGVMSRSDAARQVAEGHVRVNGRVVRDPEFPVRHGVDRIQIDDRATAPRGRIVIMLNKPRGLVTTTRDELGRDTVYRCLEGSGLPWLAPVGRLDKASEGLLLFANDPEWSARITHPASGPSKTYHVQVDRPPDPQLLSGLHDGVESDGEWLKATSARWLRAGEKNAWLEIILNEGRNRQIRRLLAGFEVSVLRLIRIAIGELELGNLAKGRWRSLTEVETDRLSGPLIRAPV